MEMKTEERIKKINTLDSEPLPIVILKFLRMIWSIDGIIEEKVDYHKSKVSKNLKNKGHIKEIKGLLDELGEDIRNDCTHQELREFLLEELLKYLGFKNDILAKDLIDGYCLLLDVLWDINKLKNHLTWWAIESEGIEEDEDIELGL